MSAFHQGDGPYLGYTIWGKGRDMKTMYIDRVPGDGGVDWSYTPNRVQAIPLSVYWRRRFETDMQRLGGVAGFSPIGR